MKKTRGRQSRATVPLMRLHRCEVYFERHMKEEIQHRKHSFRTVCTKLSKDEAQMNMDSKRTGQYPAGRAKYRANTVKPSNTEREELGELKQSKD